MLSFLRSERRFVSITIVLLAAGVFGLIALDSAITTGQAPLTTGERHPSQSRAARRATSPAQRLFAPDSVWNAPLRPDAALDPSSPKLIRALDQEIASEMKRNIGPWIATGLASTPIYRVPADQPQVHVTLDAPPNEGRAALQAAFDAVPIPPNAKPAAGLDRHVTIWQPATDTLWEFFHARRLADGWHADWGGTIRHVSESPGYYTSHSWPGATPNWGATATSLPVSGGVIRVDDIQAGSINHALALNLPAPRAGVFSWPAQRSDGTGGPDTLPEGARVRIDPRLDLSRLSLPPFVRMIAEAAQRYGMIVRDQTHHGTSLFGEDPTALGSNPYYGPRGAFGGLTPGQLLAYFPWRHLEVLKLHLCVSAPCLP